MMKPSLPYRLFKYLPLLLWLALAGSVAAQSSVVLQQSVSLQFHQVQLGEALKDISQSYQIYFSYSGDVIPVRQAVSLQVEEVSLEEALDLLLAETQVVYSHIGDQIVLKIDPAKNIGQSDSKPNEKLLGSISIPPQARPVVPYDDAFPQETPEERGATIGFMDNLQRQWEIERLESEFVEFAQANVGQWEIPMEFEIGSSALDRQGPWEQRLAQISVLPYIGTNLYKSAAVENNVSINILMGRNGAVNGVELGGFFNSVKYDVRGVQIAGLGNMVGGELEGTQIAGLFNYNQKTAYGLQAAGLLNLGRRDVNGVQLSGLANSVGGNMSGTQISGLFNYTKGRARRQCALLLNIAGTSELSQASVLLNVGREVQGDQFGLINVSDTIAGLPLGLLNIVRRGYNRLEIAFGDGMRYNFSAKLGAYRFYNIFLINARKGDTHGTGGGKWSWGLGYGFGTNKRLGTRSLMNMEVVSMHINEGEHWTSELNQLSELRVIFDWQICRKGSLFVGPVYKVMVSKLRDRENNKTGSAIPPYSLLSWDTDGRRPTNVQMWLGWTAGLRF